MRSFIVAVIGFMLFGLLMIPPALSQDEEKGETAETEKAVAETTQEEEAATTVEEPVDEEVAEEEAAEEAVAETAASKEKLKAMARFIDKKARGLKAVIDKDMEAAEEHLEEAGEIATENEDWESTLDAGYSLSTIGKTDSAKKLFDTAKSLTQKAQDWRSMLAVGYAYASLPPEQDAVDDAVEVMQDAEEIASEEDNWRALVEIGNGFKELKSAELAKATYAKALHLLEEVKDSEGLDMLARGYDELGDKVKAAEVEMMAGEARKEEAAMGGGGKIRKKKVRKAPPSGWSPTGKSLAEPPEISDTSRKILADKAKGKMMEAHEKSLMDAEAEREYSYRFKHYYFGPGERFRYRRWDVKTDFDVDAWAAHELDSYILEDGVYILK